MADAMGCSPHAAVGMNLRCQRKPEPDALVNLLFHAQYWYLARIYPGARDRFYLDQWRMSVAPMA